MARSMAARARGSSTPASSKSTRPGCTTATHSSGFPLPEPMRVSAGFWVTGLSGKTRIHTLPPRFTWRVIAIRAASIWRAVSQPGSTAWIPKSPNVTRLPPLAAPLRRPRWVLRCLTFFGINMSVRVLAEVRRLVVLLAVLTLHLLVPAQLTLQVVGLRGRGEQVGHRLLGLVLGFDLGLGLGRGLGLHAGDGAVAVGRLRNVSRTRDFRHVRVVRAIRVVGGEDFGPPTSAAGGDEPARAALARRLADGHGRLAGDLVL